MYIYLVYHPIAILSYCIYSISYLVPFCRFYAWSACISFHFTLPIAYTVCNVYKIYLVYFCHHWRHYDHTSHDIHLAYFRMITVLLFSSIIITIEVDISFWYMKIYYCHDCYFWRFWRSVNNYKSTSHSFCTYSDSRSIWFDCYNKPSNLIERWYE